jgi:hypothetical protein
MLGSYPVYSNCMKDKVLNPRHRIRRYLVPIDYCLSKLKQISHFRFFNASEESRFLNLSNIIQPVPESEHPFMINPYKVDLCLSGTTFSVWLIDLPCFAQCPGQPPLLLLVAGLSLHYQIQAGSSLSLQVSFIPWCKAVLVIRDILVRIRIRLLSSVTLRIKKKKNSYFFLKTCSLANYLQS